MRRTFLEVSTTVAPTVSALYQELAESPCMAGCPFGVNDNNANGYDDGDGDDGVRQDRHKKAQFPLKMLKKARSLT